MLMLITLRAEPASDFRGVSCHKIYEENSVLLCGGIDGHVAPG
jgi:hypothetical protein